LVVGYETGFYPPWLTGGCSGIVVTSILLSLLVMIVLATSKLHKMLLYRMMPKEAIKKVERGEIFVERDSNATIFFSHLIGFERMSGEMSPQEFLIMLTQLYEQFDRLALKHKCTKIETIGGYYIVTGPGKERCPEGGMDGVVRVALFALDAMKFVQNFQYKGMRLQIKAGFATGPIVSGVIPSALPKYTVFGDTVNFSSRMQSTSKPMMIQCPEKSYNPLRKSPGFDFELEEREEDGQLGVFVKGKGHTLTYWVKGFVEVDKTKDVVDMVTSKSARENVPDKDNILDEDKESGASDEIDLEEAIGSGVDDGGEKRRVSFKLAD